MIRVTFGTLTIAIACWTSLVYGVTKNGFDLDDAEIPAREIKPGGPPRDGIPALTDPAFIKATEADYLEDDDRVLGVNFGGQAKAYPIRILDWHEIVNDVAGKQRVAVTYCPLCGSGVVFATNIGKAWLNFGVSGLLYNSDVLLYDRNTESLWSQLLGRAVSGRLKGTELPQIPAFHTSWQEWRHRHPDTLVMGLPTGLRSEQSRNYERSPYAGYEKSKRLYFKVSHKAPATYHPKEQVLGLSINGVFKAYPFMELAAAKQSRFTDTVNEQAVTIYWDEAARSAYAVSGDGELLPTTVAFWFAWFTFHPDTEVFVAPDNKIDS
jgi:hypothetical protein